MDNTLMTTVNVGVNILLILFLMKLILKPREFYFNPVLGAVDMVTAPILKPLQKIFHPTRMGWDYTPIMAIIGLVLLKILAYVGFRSMGTELAILHSIVELFLFMVQFFAFSVLVVCLFPVYTTNPLANFLNGVVRPFESSLGGPFRNKDRVHRLVFVLICFMLLSTLILHILTPMYIQLENKAKTESLRYKDYLLSGKIFAQSFLEILRSVVSIYRFIMYILIIAAVLSWMNLDYRNTLVNVIYAISEPILAPIRRALPTLGGLDLSPWIAVIILKISGDAVMKLIAEMMRRSAV